MPFSVIKSDDFVNEVNFGGGGGSNLYNAPPLPPTKIVLFIEPQPAYSTVNRSSEILVFILSHVNPASLVIKI